MTVRIIPTAERHIAGFHAAVDLVSRERRYLSFLVGPPIEQSTAFVRGLLANGGVQFVAVSDSDEVVGWCDVVRAQLDGFRHIGRLGMGLLPTYRGAGYGRRLAEGAIAAAQRGGIERIELEVFGTNTVAIRLYERLGFQHEGVKRNGRKLDGIYDDNVLMALVRPPAGRISQG